MTPDDVRSFHRTSHVPSAVTVIAAGDGTHESLAALVEGAFGGWTGVAAAPDDEAVVADPPRPSHRLAILHRPGAAQSELRIGHMSVRRNVAEYQQLLVLNMILGAQFVSRINMNLRQDKGYTYGARTAFDARRGPGPFLLQASVQSDATAPAIVESFKEISDIRGTRPVTVEELETGRAALTRGYPRNFETAEQLARAATQLALHDLPDDYYSTFVDRILDIDERTVTAAAHRFLHPDELITIVVGDRERAGAGLDQLGLGEPLELHLPS